MSDDASVTTPRSLGQLISSLATWGLPPDLLRDVSRRLGLVALCFAGGCVWGLVAPHLFHRMGWLPEWMAHPGQPVMGAGLALGLLVYAITRHAPLSAAGIISLGLAFEILGGFVLVLSENLNLAANPQLVARPGLSWVAVWITIFPLLVPASVPVTIGAALVTASLSPVAWWVVTQLGYPRIPGATLPIILIPNYVAAALALVSAIVVRRMQRQIIEARAMGSYRLADRLGAGGMGEVWSATHRLLARPAAVKLIRRDVLAKISPEAARVWIERFRREAEAAATLRSPHTIELYDFGEAAAVVLQCLAKDADDRPDALELARRLKACPEAEAWTTQRASAWWQEHLPLSGVVPSAAGAVERPPGALEPGPTNAWPRTNP